MGTRVARPRTVADLLAHGAARLAGGSSTARLDARLLLGHAMGERAEALLAHPEWVVADEARADYLALVERRAGYEPVAYILGRQEFYGRTFRVDRRVLVPRPETEQIVEIGVAAVRRWRARGIRPLVVEVGTGGGAIAVSVAAETGEAVLATDVDWGALEVARANARMLGQAERVRLARMDLLAGVGGPIHVLLANLPYIPEGRALMPDVADYEPARALFGGLAGAEIIERALREARTLLAPGADVAFEIDEQGQGAALGALARGLYPEAAVEVRRDAFGDERVLWLRTAGPD